MSTYARFKSRIKAAKTKKEMKLIYADVAEIIQDEALYDKIIKECVKKEKKISV